jgi:hypothetical protein
MTRRLKIVASASKAMMLADELKASGLIPDKDFTWKFHRSIDDWFTSSPNPSYVVFTFYDDAMATFYELKWT